jgi:hypothetical protein
VGEGEVVHLAEDGAELWRGDHFAGAWRLSVNPADGSCWVSDCNNSAGGSGDDPDTQLCAIGELVHISEEGAELWRGGAFVYGGSSVSVNPADGSCWIASPCDGHVTLFAEDGTELWRGEDFVHPWSLSVNPTDGSCWVADYGTSQVVHLVVRRFGDVPGDFWACDEIGACVGADIVSGYEDDLYHPDSPVTRDQMAVFVSRAVAGSDGLVPAGPTMPTFQDVLPNHWAYRYIEYARARRIVEGVLPFVYMPDVPVNRGMMAVFIARSIADPTGDDGLAGYTPPDTPTYEDVTGSNDWSWCHEHVEYLAEQSIAQGYADGLYCPSALVTRAQMAVYIARAFELPAY